MALTPLQQQAVAVARKVGVPADLFLALVQQESNFNPAARSHAGALGLSQLMPGTARGLGVRNPLDPVQNLTGGATYLKQQLGRFKRPDLALSAYNSGPGGAEHHGRVEGFSETQNYVKKITADRARWARLLQGGSAGNTGASLPMTGALGGGANLPTPLQTHLSTPSGTSQDPRRKFLLQGLAQGQDIYDLIGQMAFIPQPGPTATLASSVRPVQPAGGSPTPQTTPSTPRASGGNGTAGMDLKSNPLNLPKESHVDVANFSPSFAQKLAALVASSGGRLRIYSGYRSSSLQAKLFADAVRKYGSEQAARKWVAPPGRSNHGSGIAADLRGDLSWAHKNARKFGLHFPMAHEAWHVEEIR